MHVFALVAVLAATPSAPPSDGWLSGGRFQRQMAAPVRIVWQGVPLREAIDSLARSQRTAFFLDRRVDPSKPIDFSVEGAPLRDVLGKFAEHNGLGIAIVDSVVYLGLPDRATQFAALIRDKKQQVARLPRSERQKWQKSTSLAWDALTEPRQLIAEIERQAGIRVSGQALVPHDLWAAASWPPLPAASKLALVLVGFDLAPAVEPDGSCSIVPME